MLCSGAQSNLPPDVSKFTYGLLILDLHCFDTACYLMESNFPVMTNYSVSEPSANANQGNLAFLSRALVLIIPVDMLQT